MEKDNIFSHKAAHEDVSHQAISSYFIGPQAENMPYFKDNITIILDKLVAARLRYFPQDGVSLSLTSQASRAICSESCTLHISDPAILS